MKKKLRKIKNKWGNSILLVNLKHWRCYYCGALLRDDTQFGIIKINGDNDAQIFCSEYCLNVYTLKEVAKKTGTLKK